MPKSTHLFKSKLEIRESDESIHFESIKTEFPNSISTPFAARERSILLTSRYCWAHRIFDALSLLTKVVGWTRVFKVATILTLGGSFNGWIDPDMGHTCRLEVVANNDFEITVSTGFQKD